MKLNLMIPFQKLETKGTGEEEGLDLSWSDPPWGTRISANASVFLRLLKMDSQDFKFVPIFFFSSAEDKFENGEDLWD